MHVLTDQNGREYHVSDAIFERWIAEGTVEDGESVRVPIMLMDGELFAPPQRRDAVRMVDAWGEPAGSRPGFCFPVVSDGRREEARQNYIREIGDAWRAPPQGARASPGDAGADARADYVKAIGEAWRIPR